MTRPFVALHPDRSEPAPAPRPFGGTRPGGLVAEAPGVAWAVLPATDVAAALRAPHGVYEAGVARGAGMARAPAGHEASVPKNMPSVPASGAVMSDAPEAETAGSRSEQPVTEGRRRGGGPAPKSPTQLDARTWWATIKRTIREFDSDDLTDWAAALTYYGVLSIFPGLILLASVLGLIGQSATRPLLESLTSIAPGPVRQLLEDSLRNLENASGAVGTLAVASLAGALWTASGYVGAFMRASNAIYDVPEGRPIWKTLPIRVGVTVIVGVMLAASALIVVFTGRVARWAGHLIGVGDTLIAAWSILKWPILVILVSLVFAILYWASPNARQAGFRWITPGGILAVLLWIVASIGFAVYVAHFGSYNKTYGTLGGVAVFLVWLWISNIAVLLGAELDAELHRARAIVTGHPEEQEPYVPLRDTRALGQH